MEGECPDGAIKTHSWPLLRLWPRVRMPGESTAPAFLLPLGLAQALLMESKPDLCGQVCLGNADFQLSVPTQARPKQH